MRHGTKPKWAMKFDWTSTKRKPRELPQARSMREIVIWGPRFSGKSLLIASLQRAIETHAHSFGVSIDTITFASIDRSPLPTEVWTQSSGHVIEPQEGTAGEQAGASTDTAYGSVTAPLKPRDNQSPEAWEPDLTISSPVLDSPSSRETLGRIEVRYFESLLRSFAPGTANSLASTNSDPPSQDFERFAWLVRTTSPTDAGSGWHPFGRRSRNQPVGEHLVRVSVPSGAACCPGETIGANGARIGLSEARIDLRTALSTCHALIVCWPMTDTGEYPAEHDLQSLSAEISAKVGTPRLPNLDTIVFAFTYYEALHVMSGQRGLALAADPKQAQTLLAARLNSGPVRSAIEQLVATADSLRGGGRSLRVLCTPVSGYGFLIDGCANVDLWATLPQADLRDPRRSPLMPEMIAPQSSPERLVTRTASELLGTSDRQHRSIGGRERWRPFGTLDPLLSCITRESGKLTFEAKQLLRPVRNRP